jgi:hypothetical protein
MIGPDLIALRLEEDFQGLNDVLVVVHEGDGGHSQISAGDPMAALTAP